MLEDRLFERFPCDAIFGMHNRPGLPVGKFQIRTGAMMAGGAYFDIKVEGKGAHGARPESGIDSVLVAAHIATALQAIVARNVKPTDTAVLSVTQIHGGDAYNVIPQTAVLRGTARAFQRDTLKLIEANMTRIASGVAAGFGATAATDFRVMFAPLVNDATEGRVHRRPSRRDRRGRQRQPRRQPRDGVGGFLLHAREAPGRLHPDRQRRG